MWLWRKLTKAKGPPGAKAPEEKPKGMTLFGPKPPTPKLMKAFANLRKLKVQSSLWCTAPHTHTAGTALYSRKNKHWIATVHVMSYIHGWVSKVRHLFFSILSTERAREMRDWCVMLIFTASNHFVYILLFNHYRKAHEKTDVRCSRVETGVCNYNPITFTWHTLVVCLTETEMLV